MSSTEQFSFDLPEGVNVLDLGSCVVELTRSGKIVFVVKGHGGKHVTINFGGRSGVLDAHVTDPGAARPHTPLGGIRASDLSALLEKASPSLERNLVVLARRTIRRVRFGWLGHHGIYVLPIWPGSGGLVELGTRHGKRLKIRELRLHEGFSRPLTKAELSRSKDVAYFLYRPGLGADQLYGALFKHVDDQGRVELLWFRNAQVISELAKLWRVYEPAVRSVLLGPDEVTAAIAREEPCRTSG